MNNVKKLGIVLIVVVVLTFCGSIHKYGYKVTKRYIHKNIFDEEMLINIIINVGLISAFLGIFFFTYAAGIELDIVKINTKIVTDDIMEIIAPALDNDMKANLSKNLVAPNLAHEDAEVKKNNDTLKSEAFLQLLIVLDVTLTIGFILSIIYKHSFMKIMGLNLIIVTFVGLTEFTFLHFLPHKYISADTNFVRKIILTNLHEKIIFPKSLTNILLSTNPLLTSTDPSLQSKIISEIESKL